ncbi:MAG: translation elongation factor Ts [Bacteroidales bacterium]|jgi:elongation factor Ts|nr:translation elongation factor Ts [Bacteroidales bacterium]MDD2322361.1 translation elongation factor Ts [Bacteroidales bacterium]MDD3009852.1 translation elongation factor Ts [Bacteroidales bacterium]MDD3960933.1 translation elongation factor Ts [Bacteroidales bacterium]MDY0285607.1 translation elongation factor Ts [Bacteroidales bacterium]
MTKITAQEVNNLRKITGAGMMDCKNALVEAEGNVETAIEILRKKGQKVANKRADKEASEGIVIAKTTENKDFGVVFMLNCETDFVAKNQEFVDLANAIMEVAISGSVKSMEALHTAVMADGLTVEQKLTEMIGKSGEKMHVSAYETLSAPLVSAYTHQGSRLACILAMNKAEVENIDQIGHEIAMQVAAMAPVAVDQNGIPQHIIDKELEIAKELIRQEGKPEDMVEKIAQGKLNRFFKENTLLNQVFVRDGKKTVGQYLSECDKDLTVSAFYRLMLGE